MHSLEVLDEGVVGLGEVAEPLEVNRRRGAQPVDLLSVLLEQRSLRVELVLGVRELIAGAHELDGGIEHRQPVALEPVLRVGQRALRAVDYGDRIVELAREQARVDWILVAWPQPSGHPVVVQLRLGVAHDRGDRIDRTVGSRRAGHQRRIVVTLVRHVLHVSNCCLEDGRVIGDEVVERRLPRRIEQIAL